MKIKLLKSIVPVLLFFFFVSWFYKLIMLAAIVYIWRKDILNKLPYRYTMKTIVALFILGIFIVMPRYSYNNGDRIRLIYQDENGKAELPPLSHYIINVLLPEEEIINAGIWSVRLGITTVPGIGQSIIKQFQSDSKTGISKFYEPYDKINWSGSYAMSGLTSQLANMIGLPHTKSVYVIRPKHYDEDRKYPVLFFCHGFMGNWKLYQGLLKCYDECIVVSIGTDDWSGIFGKNEINDIFTRQLPFLKNLGFNVDETQLHIMGISNGGTACNTAYNSFNSRFKSITYISTNINQSYPVKSKIIMVGGGRDGSSASMPGASKRLRGSGTPTALFWDEDETHFIFVNKHDEISDFLKKEIFND